MPLITWLVKESETPPLVIDLSEPALLVIGSMVCRPLAPEPAATVKLRTLPPEPSSVQLCVPKEEPPRPSSQVSIWAAETTGTPCAAAEAMMASEPALAAESVCMLAAKAPKYWFGPRALLSRVSMLQ